MSEPVTAADVIAQALYLWRTEMSLWAETSQQGAVERLLREACGGGDIVITTDGTLATLRVDGTPSSSGHWPTCLVVVPVERGA